MKYYVWLLKDKTKVPLLQLDTENSEEWMAVVEKLFNEGKQFAARVEE